MHITGGQARGLRIETPPGTKTRPTTDRVRESLFAILRDILPGAEVLDLYSGSGALGLEAASRGAAKVRWVEKHAPTAGMISRNFNRLAPAGVQTEGEVHIREVSTWLRGHSGPPADLIFADPPYDLFEDPQALVCFFQSIQQYEILAKEGLLLLEMRARMRPELPKAWNLLRKEVYGGTAVLFLDYSE